MTNDALIQKERQLGLLLALDQARDAEVTNLTPSLMLKEVVRLLAAHFEVDACALMLLEETGKNVEHVICHRVDEPAAIDLCKQATHILTPAPLETDRWQYTLGLQVLLRENEAPLGGVFIARSDKEFDVTDVNLLRLAESQIDSAIVQVRMIYGLHHRNRELEAIHQIDELRDRAQDEAELISGFAILIGEYLDAGLCLVFTERPDNSGLWLRGLTDKFGLSAEELSRIREATGDITEARLIQIEALRDDVHLLASPLIVGDTRLGAVVAGREGEFDVMSLRLMRGLAAQMDSALVHWRTMRELHHRNRELEAIYEIDHIRDTEDDLDKMLTQVLQTLCQAVSAEIGYLMLYNAQNEDQLEQKASTRSDLLASPEYFDVIHAISRRALEQGETLLERFDRGPVRSAIAVPLILDEKIIGVFGAVNSAEGFDEADKGLLRAITSQVDTAIFERLEHRRLRNVLQRSVDHKVIEHLLEHANENILAGERVVLSVLFADLRGSTEWAERTQPEELVSSLNQFLGAMTQVIFKYGGTLDKFVGDEVIALFGSPVPMDEHAYHAAEAALEMQALHDGLRAELAKQGKELPMMGVGISSGEVIAGEFGPPIRTDFTAMGRTMNLGARLCGVAGPGEVYISTATVEMLGERAIVEMLDAVNLKGIGETVPAYELKRLL